MNDEQQLLTCLNPIDADKGHKVNEISEETNGIAINESRRVTIDECQLRWSDVSEDDADASAVSAHENQTNVSNDVMPKPNDRTSQHRTNTVESDAYQNSSHALDNSLADECSTNDQRQLFAGAENEEVLPNESSPSRDTESDTEFHGWSELSIHFDANDFIDLTLDDDDFGQSIVNTIHSFSNGADRSKSTKSKPNRRQTYAGMQNKKQTLKHHKCKTCTFSTPYRANLVKHVRTHTNEKPFECRTCSKRYVQFQSLANHMRMHQREIISFPCSHCHRELSSEKARHSHENQCKNGYKQYECHLCKMIAFNKSHLQSHMHVHAGNINCCPKCNKQLSSKTTLKQHMIVKHAKDFKYQCKICHQVFSRRNKWKFHENRCKRKQHVCNICDRFFVNNYHLVYHMKKHAV